MTQHNLLSQKTFFRERSVQVSLLLLALLISSTLFVFGRIPPEIPLFYSRPWGLEQLAPRYSLLILLIAGISIVIVHSSLAWVVARKEKLLFQLMLWSGVLLLGFLLLAVYTIYLRVGISTRL